MQDSIWGKSRYGTCVDQVQKVLFHRETFQWYLSTIRIFCIRLSSWVEAVIFSIKPKGRSRYVSSKFRVIRNSYIDSRLCNTSSSSWYYSTEGQWPGQNKPKNSLSLPPFLVFSGILWVSFLKLSRKFEYHILWLKRRIMSKKINWKPIARMELPFLGPTLSPSLGDTGCRY